MGFAQETNLLRSLDTKRRIYMNDQDLFSCKEEFFFPQRRKEDLQKFLYYIFFLRRKGMPFGHFKSPQGFCFAP